MNLNTEWTALGVWVACDIVKRIGSNRERCRPAEFCIRGERCGEVGHRAREVSDSPSGNHNII